MLTYDKEFYRKMVHVSLELDFTNGVDEEKAKERDRITDIVWKCIEFDRKEQSLTKK